MMTPVALRNTPLTALLTLLLAGCSAGPRLVPSDADSVLRTHAITAPDPSQPGPFRVKTLFYGSGTDRRRSVFRDSVTIATQSVDASKLVDLGDSKKNRTRYWGFGPSEFPINGRVWYPEGPGPFPLVLMVHGNHNMKDFSDPGYGYLGAHLASRGFVFVSVDMNFLNGSIQEENDARGWMLLQHLCAWKALNREGPLADKADLDRIALIGHSRGGEAVAHAAAFNRLERYPDNGDVTFDFGFGIRSLIAVAPVDGQYLPTGRHVPLEDVNYMVFHGSHDGDVTSFHGLRQYHRLRFTEGSGFFKTALYVYRANHGQWNTVWNNKDRGPRSGRSLRIGDLLPAVDQRRFALVYVTAFLETTLNGTSDYLPLFRDHRVAAGWLPPTMYVTRQEHASFVPLATFEEDIDLTTGTRSGIKLETDSLDLWKEAPLELRSRNRSTTLATQQNQAAWIGWSRDSTATHPEWRLRLPPEARPPTGAGWTLELSLSPAAGTKADSLSRPGAVLDLSVGVEDASGNRAALPLSRYGAIRAPLDIRILRRDLDKDRFGSTSELVLQTYSIPLTDYLTVNPALDLGQLAVIRLEFDISPSGEIVLDQVGLAHPPPEFLDARVPAGPEETLTEPSCGTGVIASKITSSGCPDGARPHGGSPERRTPR